MIFILRSFLLLFITFPVFAQQKIVNVYAWSNEIPDGVMRQFERETGIKINFSTYDNNEIMYSKLRAMQPSRYDIVMPSSYFVDRMRKQNMLEKLDKTKLSNWKHLDPAFLNSTYDPGTAYSVPFIWGATGIFVNQHYYAAKTVQKWSALWETRFKNQLMLIDDPREVFSMALLSLGYSANDGNPAHLKEAFLKLKTLMQNVKVFSSETIISIITDEDATVGMAWNGDAAKAVSENSNVTFVYPKEGFPISVDTLAIPKNAPHQEEAYAFINFLLRPEIAKIVGIESHYPITNLTGQSLLPTDIRTNPIIYPAKEVLKHGEFQTDLPADTLALVEKYWEELKMGG